MKTPLSALRTKEEFICPKCGSTVHGNPVLKGKRQGRICAYCPDCGHFLKVLPYDFAFIMSPEYVSGNF